MKKLIFILSLVSLVFAQNSEIISSSSNLDNKSLFGDINKKFVNEEFESILRFNPLFFNSSTNHIKSKSENYLKQDILAIIDKYENNYENVMINIIGYTDHVQTKTEKVNQSWWFRTYPNDLTIQSSQEIALSYANYVQEQLVNHGIPKEIIHVEQRGDSDLLYLGTTEESRELNYRAMLSLYIKKSSNADSDNDGVADINDKCKYTPAGHPVDFEGCSEILNLTVFYKVNSSIIQDISQEKLTKVIDFMNKYENFKVVLYGHTSNEGTNLNNQILSEKRALSIRNYLIENGIKSSRISVYGKASSEPIASNDTEEGREKNRRVEIKLH